MKQDLKPQAAFTRHRRLITPAAVFQPWMLRWQNNLGDQVSATLCSQTTKLGLQPQGHQRRSWCFSKLYNLKAPQPETRDSLLDLLFPCLSPWSMMGRAVLVFSALWNVVWVSKEIRFESNKQKCQCFKLRINQIDNLLDLKQDLVLILYYFLMQLEIAIGDCPPRK